MSNPTATLGLSVWNDPIGMIKLGESQEKTSKNAEFCSISQELPPIGTKTTISTATGTTTGKSKLKNSDCKAMTVK
jgi:hypothetical protein